MKQRKILIIIVSMMAMSFILTSCEKKIKGEGRVEEKTTAILASKAIKTLDPIRSKQKGENIYYGTCLLKIKGSNEWEGYNWRFCADIYGIYEKGYEFVLGITITRFKESGELFVISVNEIISKEKKDSEGLPEEFEYIE